MTGVQFPERAVMRFFLFATVSRPNQGPTQPSIEWVPGSYHGGKAARVWSWSLTSIL